LDADHPKMRVNFACRSTIVASLRKQDGVLGIEQPELHVHPAIQVGMGDLFIKAATGDEDKLTSGKTLLIETHSEHIMLRLLRRVREQTEGEVPARSARTDAR
jgi:predicted ATPase